MAYLCYNGVTNSSIDRSSDLREGSTLPYIDEANLIKCDLDVLYHGDITDDITCDPDGDQDQSLESTDEDAKPAKGPCVCSTACWGDPLCGI